MPEEEGGKTAATSVEKENVQEIGKQHFCVILIILFLPEL